jgi:carbonic anhydrase
VVEQVLNTCHTTIVQQAWQRGQSLSIHGWIYAISDGLLKDLNVTINSQAEISSVYHVSSRAK